MNNATLTDCNDCYDKKAYILTFGGRNRSKKEKSMLMKKRRKQERKKEET